MIVQTESVILTNGDGQKLRIYKVEGNGIPVFCIGIEGSEDHFSFNAGEAEEITRAIDTVVDSFA